MHVGIAGTLYAYEVHEYVCNTWPHSLQMLTKITF